MSFREVDVSINNAVASQSRRNDGYSHASLVGEAVSRVHRFVGSLAQMCGCQCRLVGSVMVVLLR